jgi:hypothetical protein
MLESIEKRQQHGQIELRAEVPEACIAVHLL